jgi:lipopolysaccharide transport system permease protein
VTLRNLAKEQRHCLGVDPRQRQAVPALLLPGPIRTPDELGIGRHQHVLVTIGARRRHPNTRQSVTAAQVVNVGTRLDSPVVYYFQGSGDWLSASVEAIEGVAAFAIVQYSLGDVLVGHGWSDYPSELQRSVLKLIMSRKTLVIEAGLSERQYWHDLWRYRELFAVLAWRDVAVRYKQTVIGLAWAVLQPLLTMVVLTFVFGNIARMPSEGATPYALMVFAGMLPWQFFSTSLSSAAQSLLGNSNLISKIYFPRLIVPTAAIVVSFVDFLVSFSILLALMIWYQFVPSWQILTLPFFVLMAFLAALGPGLWISAVNVKYRDFRYVVPFIVSMGLYISPVGFSSSVIPEQWRLLYSVNPVVGVIDGFRWAILGGEARFYWPGFFMSWILIVCLLWFGIRRFRSMEKSFSDLI